MPSVGNPNYLSKNRLAARACKARSIRRKASFHGATKITKAETRRGARPGLLPTSGPGCAVSKKKARKLEKKLGHAERRRMEAERLVEQESAARDGGDESASDDEVKEVEMNDVE